MTVKELQAKYDADPVAEIVAGNIVDIKNGEEAIKDVQLALFYGYLWGIEMAEALEQVSLREPEIKNMPDVTENDMTYLFILCHIIPLAQPLQKTAMHSDLDFKNAEGTATACRQILPQGSYLPKTPVTEASRQVPTILLSGAVDPATPHANALLAAKDFNDPYDVLVEGGGHGVIVQPCVLAAVDRFLSGDRPRRDRSFAPLMIAAL